MRIGFVLADLFAGSAASLLPSVASMFPEDGNDTLIIFPGGRLRNNSLLDEMRNTIYRKVTPQNLDASIVWCSSLTGYASTEEVLENFSSMTELPMVTINGKTKRYPHIPDVRFNAYEGSRALTMHCIEVHGAKRFAYVRGPENHSSAQERYQAFRDSLKTKGLQLDESLITDPASWDEGGESVRRLLEERGKVPGKDFDAILFASDLMMTGGVAVLEKKGFSIPDDVIVCGFNDSLGSRVMNVPVSTARIPYSSLGKNVVSAVMSLKAGKDCPDKLLPMLPVIRMSCGCSGGNWRRIGNLQDITNEISDNFAVDPSEAKLLIDMVTTNPSAKTVRSLLEVLAENEADVFEMSSIVSGINGIDSIDSDIRRDIVSSANQQLPFVLARYSSLMDYRERNQRVALSRFNNELLEANTVLDIYGILESNASDLGFEKVLLVVSDGDMNHLIGQGSSFSENLLVPWDNRELLDSGVWIALPLCTETEEMGFLLIKAKEVDGVRCTEVVGAVSRALKGALLFEETRKAQQAAEEAEQAKMNFFARLGENLRDPLSEISEMVSGSALEEESKQAILKRIDGASNMLDLSLSETDELELNPCMSSISELLESFSCYECSEEKLPFLLFDEARIRQALGILVADMGDGVAISARIAGRGVRIEIRDRNELWKPSSDDVGFTLAQRIFLLHGGTCSSNDYSFVATLPYPTLSGAIPRAWEDGSVVACIEGIPPINAAEGVLERVRGSRLAEKRRLPVSTGAIYWDMGFKGYDALSALLVLSSNETYRNLPFICYDCPSSKSLEDSIRASVEAKGKTILHVGTGSVDLYRWLQDQEVIECDMNNAVSMYRKNEPGLVLVSLDEYVNTLPATMSFLNSIRSLHRVSQSPVLICADYIDEKLIEETSDIPNLMVLNTCIMESDEFAMRIRAILGGSPLTPTSTAAIVRKAQAYICTHATLPISRWQIAEEVHVSEDYLTRIFKKELGLSPWDYLNRYRVWLATRLLRNTGMSVNEVSVATGFQDQAYFCRVFKKVRGFSPSKIRSANKMNR